MENRLNNFLLESYEDAQFELMNEDYDEFILEAQKKRPFKEYKAEAEKLLKDQFVKYAEMIKKNPGRAEVYKSLIDVVKAKEMVLKMKEKAEAVKAQAKRK
jgi:hypothetical protein